MNRLPLNAAFNVLLRKEMGFSVFIIKDSTFIQFKFLVYVKTAIIAE